MFSLAMFSQAPSRLFEYILITVIEPSSVPIITPGISSTVVIITTATVDKMIDNFFFVMLPSLNIYTTRIIISNILFNAIKYSSENSPIDVTVTSGEYIKIIISDKGIGIPKTDQKNVFKRFFRASNVSHLQGTGIGLNIVKLL